MTFYNPVTVELFDMNDEIIMPVTVPISITYNLQAFDFNYLAVQVETYDRIMKEVLSRWANKELIQYRISGRFGVGTGDLNSVYAYDAGAGSSEFSFYGRSHKEIMNNTLGFIDPSLNAVQRTYAATHKVYKGSALKVMRDVLTDNVVNRLGVPMTFPSGNLGEQVDIDFRFDEIHKHFYLDGIDKGGAVLAENGNVIFDITRNFAQHRYELTAREPDTHEQLIEMKSGRLDRWQVTADRGEANRIVVGGPREMADRVFGSTEADGDAPKTQSVAKSEKALIESRKKQLVKDRDSALAAERTASAKRKKALNATRQKALSKATVDYNKAIKAATKTYDAAMAKAKTDSARNSAKYTFQSAKSSAQSTRVRDRERAQSDYKDALKEENTTQGTNLKTIELAYKTNVATQNQLLKTLLNQWPYPNRRFPAEMFTEDTSPDDIASEKLNPTDPQEMLNTITEIANALNKTAVTKRADNGPQTDVSGELVETDQFYLGEHILHGDYVKIGIDRDTEIGTQQIDKVIITWSKDDGYKVQLTKPDDTATTEEDTLKRILSALQDLSTKTRRR